MCGIAGCLGSRGASAEENGVAAMMDALAHRGPDDRGIFRDFGNAQMLESGPGNSRNSAISQSSNSFCVLGHNRLSIIDLSPAGHQPMTTADGRFTIVHNGEVVNFKELRAELGPHAGDSVPTPPRPTATPPRFGEGHGGGVGGNWRSQTDTEVILRAWERWGEGCLERLGGMFAFAIWDAKDRRLHLSRDPMGIKPLYYWWSSGGSFYFASEIKAFLSLPGFEAEADPRSIRQFLELNFIYDEHATALRGVRKLPPGHVLSIGAGDLRDGARPRPRPYYRPPAVEPADDDAASLDARADRLHEKLRRIVCQHLIADVPVGVLLSGGLDSSLIAALAARQGPVRTLTMSFADSEIDERPFARRVAEAIGSEHSEVSIRPEEMVERLEGDIWFVDDLFGDWGVISTMALYRKCRDFGLKVALVGEGADEIFGGYPNFVSAGGAEADGLAQWRRTLRLYRWYSARRWGRELPRFAGVLRDLDGGAGDPFSTVRLFETRRQLPSDFNMKVDKASMSASIEARVPYLDVRIADEGFRAPRNVLLRDGTNKFLLRRVAERHGLLPPDIVSRKKFGAPLAATWMDDSPGFRAFARDVVLDSSGWAKPLGLRRAMELYFDRGRRGYPFPHPVSLFRNVAWRLLMLNLWSRSYLAKRSAA